MCYFWHNRTKEQNIVIHTCKQCQLVKKTISIRLESIPMWDHFYKVVLDTIGMIP